MGTLIPEDFSLDLVKNEAERAVIEAFVKDLWSDWLIIPNLRMQDLSGPHETDIVLVNANDGVVVVEVKGHPVQVRDGRWVDDHGNVLDPQPEDQAVRNSKVLEAKLRASVRGLELARVEWCVAFPNTKEVRGDLPMGIAPSQVLVRQHITDAQDSIDRLILSRKKYTVPMSAEQVAGVVHAIAPNVDFVWDPEARATATKEHLQDLCEAHMKSLVSLASNRRVVARGGAGTGKTHLGIRWATKAWQDDERVMFTCYNDPLAASIRERLGFIDDDMLTVCPFLRLGSVLDGIPELEPPTENVERWWQVDAVAHLISNWPNVTRRFDTIIIDEAQDFSPAWIALLETLLDPDGSRRTLILADGGQSIYERGFVFPHADDGWVQVELTNNYRNARPIAGILYRWLGGAPAPKQSPEGIGVRWRRITEGNSLEDLLSSEFDRLFDLDRRAPSSICVATLNREMRDYLREEFNLVAFEDRGPDQIVCETSRRLKGLEFDTVIIVADEHCDDLALLYVAVSRAISELIVISPAEFADQLGLVDS